MLLIKVIDFARGFELSTITKLLSRVRLYEVDDFFAPGYRKQLKQLNSSSRQVKNI